MKNKTLTSLVAVMLMIFMIPTISRAASFYCPYIHPYSKEDKHGKDKHGSYSIGGVYHEMYKNGSEWLKSTPIVGSNWGNESCYIDGDINEGKTVFKAGAMCFGHRLTDNKNGNSNQVITEVIDIKKDQIKRNRLAGFVEADNENYKFKDVSDFKKYQLAYFVQQATAKAERSYHEDNYDSLGQGHNRMLIRDWLFKYGYANIQSMTNRRLNFENSTGNGTNGNAAVSESVKYANKMNKINTLDIDADTDTNVKNQPTIEYKDGKTYIGPYKFNYAYGKITDVQVQDSTNKWYKASKDCEYRYNSTESWKASSWDKWRDQDEGICEVRIIYEGVLSDVKQVWVQKEIKYINSRVVVTQPKYAEGQNVAIFYGEEATGKKDDYGPGVPSSKIEITKKDSDTGEKLEGVEFIVKHGSQGEKACVIAGTPAKYGISEDVARQANNTYKTGKDGKLVINNLTRTGTYYIYEVRNPNQGYLPEPNKLVATKEIGSIGQTVSVPVDNQKVYGFEFSKTDQDSGKTLPDVEFIIRYQDDGTYITNEEQPRYVKTKEDAVKAPLKPFKSDANGKVLVKNLTQSGTYEILEIKNDHFGYEEVSLENPILVGTITVSDGGVIKKDNNITNQRKYVKLSGYAWEDIGDGKGTVTNGYYLDGNADSKDKRLANVTVELYLLKNPRVPSITKVTNEKGEYEMGNYKENPDEKIEIKELDGAYIRFKYNGMCYKTVKVDTSEAMDEKSNKAAENSLTENVTEAREGFNNRYATIENGKALINNGASSHEIYYKSENHKSTVDYSGKDHGEYLYGYPEQKYPISGIDAQYIITADTSRASDNFVGSKYETKEKFLASGEEAITNINLGLVEREMPDLAVLKDLDNVKISINGYTHVYNYAQRYQHVPDPSDPKYEAYYDEANGSSGFGMGVKFGQEYGEQKYFRPIYESDYTYEGPGENLEVKLTYRIRVRNEATSLKTRVNSIVDYYDSNYTLEKIETTIKQENENKEIELTPTEPVEQGNYNRVEIDTSVITIEPQKEQDIYVQFDLSRDLIERLINNKEALDNVVEINSYSTFDKEDKVYAGIDEDSNPGNANPNDRDTYEDDTDSAPALQLTKAAPREMSGTVFFDEAMGETGRGKTRNGSGKYESDVEAGIKDVRLQLTEKRANGDVVYDRIDADGNVLKHDDSKAGNIITDDNGNFNIKGFIPGKYDVTYIWDDNVKVNGKDIKITVQNYKGTIVDETTHNAKGEGKDEEWYKDSFKQNYVDIEWNKNGHEIRRSDATDDLGIRQAIDNQLKELNRDTKKQEDLIKEMVSTTPRMNVRLENKADESNMDEEFEKETNGEFKKDTNGEAIVKEEFKCKIKSIDFGIAERARQEITLDKRVLSFKFTYPDGQSPETVYLKKNIEGNMEFFNSDGAKIKPKFFKYLLPKAGAPSYNNGSVTYELDNEMLDGSSVEVVYEFTATNNSEFDYAIYEEGKETEGRVDESYYLYGKPVGKPITIAPSVIVDYLDEDWAFDKKENEDWEEITIDDLDDNYVYFDDGSGQGKEVAPVVGNRRILKTESLANEHLEPTEQAITTLKVSKELAAKDEIELDNETEIVKANKPGGSVPPSTPGNYEPGTPDYEPKTEPRPDPKPDPAPMPGKEPDSSRSETVIVIPNTGDNLSYTIPIAIGVTILTILGVGIVVIKKKVLD